MKFIVRLVAALGVVACHSTARSTPPVAAAATTIRMADCRGPAMSLPDSLARRLAPRTGRMHPDDQWADLASTVPGGFAGVFYDSAHTPILMLTQPGRADAAKKALVARLAFPVEHAVVRSARWDFAQLVDWFDSSLRASLWAR